MKLSSVACRNALKQTTSHRYHILIEAVLAQNGLQAPVSKMLYMRYRYFAFLEKKFANKYFLVKKTHMRITK